MQTIELFDDTTGTLNGRTVTMDWDDFSIILDGKRMIVAQPNRDYWYLMTIITAGATFQVHISDFTRCQITLKPYAVCYVPAVFRYQAYHKTPFQPEPIVSTKTPQELAQACKERGIAYSQIEISLDAPDYRQFLAAYQD